MGTLVRWAVAVSGSLAAFVVSWAVGYYLAGLNNGTALGIAGAVLAVALAVLAWWAGHETGNAPAGPPGQSAAGYAVIGGADLRGAFIHIDTGHDDACSLAGQRQPAGPVVAGNVPQQPPAFQPRDRLMDALRQHVGGTGICVIHALTGMRGVGKTQAAATYARDCINRNWRLVAWVNAETSASTLDGLTGAAAAIGISAPGKDQAAVAHALRNWLEGDGYQCLIVFDNAADPDVLRPFLPAVGRAHIVVTSTNQSVSSLGTPLAVDAYTEAESVAYLAQRAGLPGAEGVNDLAAELGYLPLALAQAAAVVTAQRLTYREYLSRLRAFPVGRYLIRTQADPYPHALASAILLAFQAACDTDADGICAPAMNLIALLSPAGAPRDLLRLAARDGILRRRATAEAATVEAVDTALARLADASLLTFSLDGSSISAHRLTARVIREDCLGQGDLPAAAGTAVTVLQAAIRAADPVWRHVQVAQDLIQQVASLAEFLDAFPDDQGAGVGPELLRLRRWSSECLNELGSNPAQAISSAEALVADHGRLLGASHADTLAARDLLAFAYRQVGRLGEAISLYERSMADYERTLGPDHPSTLAARNDLAYAYREAGRLNEAILLFERVAGDRARILGSDDPSTLASRNHLAYAYRQAGQPDMAITLYERNLADRERALGAAHPETMASRNNLALAYEDVGRQAQAISLLERTLADRERVLGADHRSTLRSRGNLAYAYRTAGRPEEALRLAERTAADYERLFGPDAPDTLAARSSLAGAYQAAGQLPAAVSLYERTLTDRERVLGTDHPRTVASRGSLAGALQAAGRLPAAIALYERALTDFERVLGAEHPRTIAARNDLSQARRAERKPPSANTKPNASPRRKAWQTWNWPD